MSSCQNWFKTPIMSSYHGIIKTRAIYLSRLPWIFPGAPLKIYGAPRNIQGNLDSSGAFVILTTCKPCLHIEAWTGWHFVQNIFKYIFFKDNFCILIPISLKFIFSWDFNWQELRIGSGNGLAQNRWKAITWTSGNQNFHHYMAPLGPNELIRIKNETWRHLWPILSRRFQGGIAKLRLTASVI